jgi:hypothetical protein
MNKSVLPSCEVQTVAEPGYDEAKKVQQDPENHSIGCGEVAEDVEAARLGKTAVRSEPLLTGLKREGR